MRKPGLTLLLVFIAGCDAETRDAGAPPADSAAAESAEFRFESNVGVMTVDSTGAGCLVTRGAIGAGTPLLLITATDTQNVLRAEVGPARASLCPSEVETSSENLYRASVAPAASLETGMLYFGVRDSGAPWQLRDGRVEIDLDRDGTGERFRDCTSAEGLHLTVWSGTGAGESRRWHWYVYLGYDVEPSCTDADFPPDTTGRGALAVRTSAMLGWRRRSGRHRSAERAAPT